MAGSILTGALVGGAASIIGGNKAADAQQDAMNQAAFLQQQAAEKAEKQLRPFSEAGRSALSQFQEGLDVNYSDVIAGIEDDPFYKFQLEQGLDAVQGSAAAGGNLKSGRTLKALTEFSSGLASQQAQQAFERQRLKQSDLFNLAQQGLNADTNVANIGIGQGGALSSLALASGANRADSIANQFNAGKTLVAEGLAAYGRNSDDGGVTTMGNAPVIRNVFSPPPPPATQPGFTVSRADGGVIDFGTPTVSF